MRALSFFRAILRPFTVVAMMLGLAVSALALGSDVGSSYAHPLPGSPHLELDMDPTNGSGPCNPVDVTARHKAGDTYQVALCLTDFPESPAAFGFDLLYDDTLNQCAPTACLAEDPHCLDSNPDANAGATIFLPGGLDGDWDCTLYSWAPSPTCESTMARIACGTLHEPHWLPEDGGTVVLSEVYLHALAPGTDHIVTTEGVVLDYSGATLADCWAVPCVGGTDIKVGDPVEPLPTLTPTNTPTKTNTPLPPTPTDTPTTAPTPEGATYEISIRAPTPENSGWFGWSLDMGEVNNDGSQELVVGAPGETVDGYAYQGRAYVFSASDGRLLLELQNPSPSYGWFYFGRSVAMGDLNGDGAKEIIVAAPEETVGANRSQGRVYVFSGFDGSLLRILDPPEPQGYGYFGALAAGDVNGDGKEDIVVGASGQRVGPISEQGRVYVFSGSDYSLLFTLDSPNPVSGGSFGSSVETTDLNGDGNIDILVGSGMGQAFVFSGASGSLRYVFDDPTSDWRSRFGAEVAAGDVDGDETPDVLVGAPGRGYFVPPARVYAYSGATGAPLFEIQNPSPYSNSDFACSLAVGDLNSDGRGETIVGARFEQTKPNVTVGRVYVFGLSGTLLFPIYSPDSIYGFGTSLAIGDVLGRRALAVGAYSSEVVTIFLFGTTATPTPTPTVVPPTPTPQPTAHGVGGAVFLPPEAVSAESRGEAGDGHASLATWMVAAGALAGVAAMSGYAISRRRAR